MEDYKQQMAELFSRYYSPIGEEYQKRYYTTFAIHMMFKSLIPSGTFDEHTTYEILKELGYYQELNVLTKQVTIVEETDETDEEKDTVVDRKTFCWVLYEKDLD